MIKILSIPFSILAYSWFLLSAIFFHPVQWICYNLFGYQAHKKSVDALDFFLIRSLDFTLSVSKFYNRELIPQGVPLIFVANHQGIFDIVGMAWYLRKFHPKFVSKIELGKGIPSVSYNLRHGGSVLIDRKDPKQALPEMKKMGEYIQQHNRSVIIYPEGTRTKDGKPKAFAANGLKILCKYAPDAFVVPVTINNSWKVFRYGSFPLGLGNKVTFTVHPPISVKDSDFNTLFEETERAVVTGINY
ncbi:MAG: phospholipid/glycerol acyltransferase [Bacteroidetes bacterium]|jgi:1-acyl-sn-glycerol-3-phosphate acyltransferase|nr:phospholipid/glycerol acyltransferase [Bacteroidota bacterium]